ncbi:MAG: IS30 family transposase [Elusimicrobiota bacterium]
MKQEDRDYMALLKAQGKSLRDIAKALGRDVSTVSRELRRNTSPLQPSEYMAHQAQRFADGRKALGHERKRLRAPGLRTYVTTMLKLGWSPERIAGRWKFLGHESISHEAIYQWIYAECRNMVPWLLRAHRRRRRSAKQSPHRTWAVPSRTPISQRPESVQLRQEAGHWEGDTIISSKSKAALQVLVERKTRYTRLKKLPAKSAACVERSICTALRVYPEHLRRTITYDNGSENMRHLQINKRLGTASYFCEPMHSWEKGSVENVAGLVRRRLPKKTDFGEVSAKRIKYTEHWLNSLPRKCLGFQTPAEAFRQSVALNG